MQVRLRFLLKMIQQQIEVKLKKTLSPKHLEVINESSKHNVPPGLESHFKVIVISDQFEGKSLLERHQMIHQILAQELKEKIHALSLQLHTPLEWAKKGAQISASPPCLGGSKHS